MSPHRQDADCVDSIDPATDTCTVCHVVGGEPCATCGAERYHDDACETIAHTRAALAAIAERCDPGCPGWVVASGGYRDGYGLGIQRCDDCTAGLTVTDDDVATLPEARAALAAAIVDATDARCAP